ncbi:MFS transporter [Enterococcus thailandicus]|uniref:MFS transporter n=1 Tax=Enterococcus thailandicus TaxID=417368 RepID=A0A510WF07_ENTTH|nr:MFS transporter [Enterococcus thailandicus]MDK4352037.1 MFS transporter [Enterococcus thailandicus]MDT2734453.1 MFS transporter [Enterococcus thailandicus]MEA4829372.1 MFS transporter [Enterococcus thailandicus]OJG94680.1 major facilitator superfamily transporter [Enterococcus thailandicus]GEK37696.1 MFS transporter [Enterococcus thailandicus]
MEQKNQIQLTGALTTLLATTCGVVVANMYYIQPIGTKVATSFSVSTSAIGILTMLTQLGYALGLLFLVPLGDVVNRPKLIIRMAALSAISLLAAFFAPSFTLFACASFLIGLLSIVPQIIIPYGAVLAGSAARGKVMGQLLSGLLIGILLSRTVSGIIASVFSWRMVYLFALLAVGLLTALLYVKLPRTQESRKASVSYIDSLKSLPHLFTSQRLLRESAFNGFFMFGTFSIFWSTLIFYISSPVYHWGTFEAGILAIFGLSGAVAAPIVGRLADSYSERKIISMGLWMQTLSFVLLLIGGNHLTLLLFAIILLDVGNQFGQVSNQARVQGLGEEASNRNNTIFMFMYFIGGATGSLVGTTMWEHFGWMGVTLAGLAFQACAYFCQLVLFRKK